MHTSIYTFRCTYRYRQIYVYKYAFTLMYIYMYIHNTNVCTDILCIKICRQMHLKRNVEPQ